MDYVCYLLIDNNNKTSYVGITNDKDKRLRQHNQEIKGGAKATKGKVWNRALHIKGFPTKHDILQFEWYWKYITNKFCKSYGSPIERRVQAINIIDEQGKTTKTSNQFNSYPNKLELIIEDPLITMYIEMNEIEFKHFIINN